MDYNGKPTSWVIYSLNLLCCGIKMLCYYEIFLRLVELVVKVLVNGFGCNCVTFYFSLRKKKNGLQLWVWVCREKTSKLNVTGCEWCYCDLVLLEVEWVKMRCDLEDRFYSPQHWRFSGCDWTGWEIISSVLPFPQKIGLNDLSRSFPIWAVLRFCDHEKLMLSLLDVIIAVKCGYWTLFEDLLDILSSPASSTPRTWSCFQGPCDPHYNSHLLPIQSLLHWLCIKSGVKKNVNRSSCYFLGSWKERDFSPVENEVC